MTYMEYQLQQIGHPGLVHYVKDLDKLPWSQWPLATVNWGQESMQVSSAHWLHYDQKANLDIVSDNSHGAWNDCKNSAKSSGY